MKQITKAIYSFALVMLGIVAVNAQNEENLFRNGDFKQGTEGWNLGRDFTLGGDSSYPYIQTGYVGSYNYPNVSTEGQEVSITSGATYIFSFWSYNLNSNNLSGHFMLKDSNDNSIENIQGIEGVSYNNFYFTEVEADNGWKKFQKEITFPAGVDVDKLVKFSISLTGSNLSYKRITEISMVKTGDAPVVPTPPAGFGVAEDMLFQRAAKFTWEAEEGKVYKLELNGETYTIENQDNFYVSGLTPNTEYTAELYTDTDTEVRATVTFTTSNYIEANEENRTPFLANIDENGNIAKVFRYHINDLSGAKITAIEFTLDGTPADNQNGVITLSDVSSGKLMVKVTQEGGVMTTLTYNSVNINQ